MDGVPSARLVTKKEPALFSFVQMQSHDSYVREYNVIEYKGYVRLLIDVVARSVDWPCVKTRVSAPLNCPGISILCSSRRLAEGVEGVEVSRAHERYWVNEHVSSRRRRGSILAAPPAAALGRIRRPCAGAQVASTRWFTYGTAQPG